jgi:hypothetical protein
VYVPAAARLLHKGKRAAVAPRLGRPGSRLQEGRRLMSLLTLLIILLVIAILFGGYGSNRGWGYYGWSPVGLLVLILLILLLTGNLHL